MRSIPYYYRFFTDPIGTVAARFEQYGDIYCAPSDGQDLFVLRHPDHIRQVLATDSSSYSKAHTSAGRLEKVLGQGLLTLEGDRWKRHRRMIQPAFTRQRLAGYGAAMVDETNAALGELRPGSSVDVSTAMMELTLRVVARTLFSHDVSGDTGDVAGAMRALNQTLGRPDVLPPWMPSPGRKRAQRAIESLDRIVYSIVEARQEGRTQGEDLLQILVDAVDEEGDGGRLSGKEVRDELVTLFLAGHETTSHALSWTFYLLARNPGARRRLELQLAQVLGGRAPTMDDLDDLPMVDWIIKEAMRLYPPAFAVTRRAERDTEIGEYAVAAGSEVVVWIYMTHHDARWFPEPEVFRPERFEAAAVAERPKMAYLPFGGGPRQCIGAQFSLLEARLVLATIAQRVRLDVEPGFVARPRTGVTLSPRGGLPMVVAPAPDAARAA